MKRMRKKRTRTRTRVSNPPSLSLFLHGNGIVDLIDDNDKNDKTLYRVFQWWNDNKDNQEIDDTHWDTMLSCVRECAEAIQGSHRQTSDVGLHD